MVNLLCHIASVGKLNPAKTNSQTHSDNLTKIAGAKTNMQAGVHVFTTLTYKFTSLISEVFYPFYSRAFVCTLNQKTRRHRSHSKPVRDPHLQSFRDDRHPQPGVMFFFIIDMIITFVVFFFVIVKQFGDLAVVCMFVRLWFHPNPSTTFWNIMLCMLFLALTLNGEESHKKLSLPDSDLHQNRIDSSLSNT